MIRITIVVVLIIITIISIDASTGIVWAVVLVVFFYMHTTA